MDAPYEGVGMNSRNRECHSALLLCVCVNIVCQIDLGSEAAVCMHVLTMAAAAAAAAADHMWSAVSTYLVQQLAGLNQQPHSAGYSDLVLTPGAMPGPAGGGGISAASASLDLPRGTASIDWAWSGGTHCATAADGSEMVLSCGARGGTITALRFASYGSPDGQCGAFTSNSACDHASAPAALEKLCLGRSNCSVVVGPEMLGTTTEASCAQDAAHAQRLHAEVVCSAPPSLQLDATVPLSSVGTVTIETPLSRLMMVADDGNNQAVVWDRADEAVAAAAATMAGVRAVTQTSDDTVKVQVGSGSFSFLLV
jgi:hypothetical protein